MNSGLVSARCLKILGWSSLILLNYFLKKIYNQNVTKMKHTAHIISHL